MNKNNAHNSNEQLMLDKIKILLVDDNDYVCSIIKQFLKRFGFEKIIIAHNGDEAKQLIINDHDEIDLLIADLIMNPTSGLELLKWVRFDEDSPNKFLPFIMVSGAGDLDKVRTCRNLGVNDFITKPIAPKNFYERILKIILEPKLFISTSTYFGPDRRTIDENPPEGIERREQEKPEVPVVDIIDKKIKIGKTANLVFYRLPNIIRNKAETDTMQANNLLKKSFNEKEFFIKLVFQYLDEINNLIALAEKEKEKAPKAFTKINLIINDLKKLTYNCGYNLAGLMAQIIHEKTKHFDVNVHNLYENLTDYTTAIRIIINQNIKSDTGKTSEQILEHK